MRIGLQAPIEVQLHQQENSKLGTDFGVENDFYHRSIVLRAGLKFKAGV
jgi:hypothetical protein